ncbi:hypothetical protein [Chroococcus sp. FPU101]|uniref:hypothetical protein n=1 Tax=Chroococcus sp. FPU101 TaxID=1974212 RepID=UPI001A8F6883|nr:hypothetical protein [Chroococcus sp. FPU101]
MAIFNAVSQDDILIFIDGDAFPIQPIMPWLYEKFKNYPLMAVKRFENDQDNHPHPLFCATTVGFWKEIKGDWKAGYYWQNPRGDLITDVGANLLKNLEDRKISWYPLLRSNKINYHPVNLGVYEDLIYHHGSGFRSSLTRKDLVDMNIFTRILDKLLMIIPSRKVEKKLASLISTRIKIKRNIINKNDQISQEIFDKIKQNPEFYREFI